ncbi:helix-turn-helix domain-containing protein [Bifidobacterium bombi]|uniref:DNA-binding protein n=1 Tax=Bifidobacterium bombi DSM 19703 TaxID=1341695 RepID=A0A080N3X4_9BIFI|nr:helix-turn-helix domain-containing protein [Bifidobacterium bombi]KFF30865.1 DNA-binding protein [Bifidobacterium bombi DSM 19703]
MSQTQEPTNENTAATSAKLLTPAEVTEILVIPVSTLNAWRAQKIELPYVHIGRQVRYRPEDVTNLIRRNTVRPE